MAYNQFISTAARDDSDNPDFFDGVTDFLQYGITSSLTSGAVSIANTGIALANTFGGEYETYDTESTIESTFGTSTGQYYEEHKAALDTLGFVATSIVPGSVGVKAVRAALRGGASSNLKLISGLSQATNKGKYAKEMRQMIARGGNADAIAATKRKAIAAGYYKNAVEAAAAETAIALTMNQSPMLNNDDLGYFDSVGNYMTSMEFWLGAGLGTGIGGTMDFAQLHKSQKSLFKLAQQKANKTANIKQVGELAGLKGDKAAYAVANYRKLMEEGVGNNSNQIVKENLQTQYEVVQKEMLNLSGNDAEVAQAMTRLVLDEGKNIDEAAGSLSGARSITRPWANEDLGKVRSVPSYMTEEDEFLEFHAQVFKAIEPELTIEQALAKATEEFGKASDGAYTRGLAWRARGLTVPASTNPLEDVSDLSYFSMARITKTGDWAIDKLKENEAINVLRHEMGHLTADFLGTLFDDTSIGKRLASEAQALSRKRRPDQWGISQEHDAYLMKPVELMADSWTMFDDPLTRADAIASAPTLYKLLRQNRLLDETFGDTKKFINLHTGESSVEAVEFTVADVGKVTLDETGNVRFGRKGERSVNANKNFDPETMDSLEASAYWYAWNHPQSPLRVSSGEKFKWNDLPRLHHVAKKVEKGEMGIADTFTIKTRHGEDMEVYAADIPQLLKDTKAALAEKMRGTSAQAGELGDLAPIRNYHEIARVLDVDTKVAQFGSTATELEGSVWRFSDVYDVDKPLHAVARYSRDTLDEGQISGLIEVNQRLNVAREHADSLNSQYFGQAASTLPDSGYRSGNGYLPSQDISSADKAASALGSVQGEYFDGTAFFQHVGAFLDTQTKRMHKELNAKLAPVAERLNGTNKKQNIIELNVLDSVLRRDHYTFMPSMKQAFTDMGAEAVRKNAGDGAKAQAELAAIEQMTEAMRTAGLEELLEYQGGKQIWTETASKEFYSLVDKRVTDMGQWQRFADEYIGDYKSKQVHRIESDDVAEYWRTRVEINDAQVTSMAKVKAAKGQSTNARTGRLYPGRLDTNRYKYVAFVTHSKPDALNGHKGVGIIGAMDESSLRMKMQQAQDRWGDSIKIETPTEKRRRAELQGLYDQQHDLGDLAMDSELRKLGTASDVLPEPDELLLNKYQNDIVNYETSIARNHIEVKYGEEFAALENYGREARDVAQSTWGNLFGKGKALNAWDQQKKVALNITNDDAFGQYRQLQQTLDQKVTAMYDALKGAMNIGNRNKWTTKDVAKLESTMEQYGFAQPFSPDSYLGRSIFANANRRDSGILSGLATRGNGLLARLMLRLDTAHGLVNAMSLPIMLTPELMALRKAVSTELAQKLDVATNVRIPEHAGHAFPTNGKLMMQATKDFFNKDIVEDYVARGIIPSDVRDVLETTDTMGLFAKSMTEGKTGAAKAALEKVEEVLGKPTDMSERFTHFVAARSADLLLDQAVKEGAISSGTKFAAMQSFMRRVNGNYIAAQRPQLFQGYAGQTIGLFQTYQMNLMYNMFRHLGDNKRAAATMVGAQVGIFGTASIPGFDWLNQKILERTQAEHDFYSASNEMFGDEATEWGMYGLASNFTKPFTGEGIALYGRGNLDPMNATIIPVNPADFPAVKAATNFVTSVSGFANNVAGGAPVGQAFYHALAHNGLNRPLQGLGEMLQDGITTRSSGNLIAGINELDWWESATRALGAKPLDTTIATENFYRMEKYRTARAQKIKKLGGALKEKIRSGEEFVEGEMTGFMQNYVAAGGRYDQFENWMMERMADSTDSQINQMRNSLQTTEGRYLQRVLNGGVSDFE